MTDQVGMTFPELMELLHEHFPGSKLGKDDKGKYVIKTNLMEVFIDGKSRQVPFQERPWPKGWLSLKEHLAEKAKIAGA